MSTEANKKVALDYFACITTGRLDDGLKLLADDVTQWIQGSQRTMTKADIRRLLTFELGTFKGDPVFKVNGTTSEGNRVAIECELDAPLTNGKRYQNKYHVLVEVEGGKLKRIMEYTDTAAAQRAFSEFMQGSSTPDNLVRALSYFDKVNSGDLDAAMAMLSENATLWLPGRGTLDKQAIRELYSGAQGMFVGNPSFNVLGTTVQGNRVAIECEMGADLKNGGRYDNQYHMLFEFDGDKIQLIREYTDSAPARAAFG
jgi:uncharacterized protein